MCTRQSDPICSLPLYGGVLPIERSVKVLWEDVIVTRNLCLAGIDRRLATERAIFFSIKCGEKRKRGSAIVNGAHRGESIIRYELNLKDKTPSALFHQFWDY